MAKVRQLGIRQKKLKKTFSLLNHYAMATIAILVLLIKPILAFSIFHRAI